MSVSHNPAILLQCWLSPGYPVGSYAYSHGLEWFAESGAITDESGLQQWLAGTLTHGAGRQDAIFISECYARTKIKNRKERLHAWRELAVFACASCTTQELRNESLQQGAAFVQVTRAAWPHARMEEGYSALGENTPYPVCFGLTAAAHRVERSQACRAYLLALAASWISAAIRLNLTGQTNGQKILAAMAPVADLIATQTRDAQLDDLGSCTFANDLASLQHAVLPARLFRS